MIFGMWNRENLQQYLIDLPTSPVCCSRFTLGNPNSHLSTLLFIYTSHYLRYLRIKWTVTVIVNLPITPEKMSLHYLLKCRTHSSHGRYRFPPNVGGSEKSRLCRVATWMWGKQRHSKCSKWPPSAWMHASGLFRHWSVASSTTLCWNSAIVSTNRCRNSCISGLVIWYLVYTLLPQMQ